MSTRLVDEVMHKLVIQNMLSPDAQWRCLEHVARTCLTHELELKFYTVLVSIVIAVTGYIRLKTNRFEIITLLGKTTGSFLYQAASSRFHHSIKNLRTL